MTEVANIKPRLLYLVYGPDVAYHREAQFSILSALYRAADSESFSIVVYTDAPAHYQHLPVTVYPLAPETLQQWAGELRYHHRSKLCVLQQAVPLASKTVFIDTDTFFLRDPALLFVAVDDKACVVDELYHSQLSPAVAQDLAVAALLQQYKIEPKNIPVINSGLFGIACSNAAVLDLALRLNDAVYPASNKSLTTEQLVLGMAAATQTALQADDGVIKHYWSRKQLFRAKASAFIAKHGAQWDTEAARRDFLRVTPAMPKPPVLIRSLMKLLTLVVPQPARQLLLELFYARFPYRNPFDRACQDAWREKAWKNYYEKKAEKNKPKAK
ncbi:MAG: hypothetical protein IPK30_05250 [Cellvibrionales bacterium]|nr:hypothetical protein [Cellvibrionales bacterium]